MRATFGFLASTGGLSMAVMGPAIIACELPLTGGTGAAFVLLLVAGLTMCIAGLALIFADDMIDSLRHALDVKAGHARNQRHEIKQLKGTVARYESGLRDLLPTEEDDDE